MRLRPLFPAVGLAVALALPARPGHAADDPVVARVNGEAVTLGQMRAMVTAMGAQADSVPPAALWAMLLDQMVRQTALAQAGEAAMAPGDEAALALQRRAYLAALALEKVAAPEPAEAELRAAYDKAFAGAAPATEYNASHILVDSAEAAAAVEADLAAGQDFGKVAEARSTGSSGPNKGDLGWFTLDMMVKPFADAVAGLAKGEVSAPVQTEFGWHVIRLNDSRTRVAPGFEEVREQLAQQVRRDRVEAEAARLMAAAKIEKTEGLDPALLKGDK